MTAHFRIETRWVNVNQFTVEYADSAAELNARLKYVLGNPYLLLPGESVTVTRLERT